MSRQAAARVLDEARGIRAMTGIMAIMLFLTVLAGALGLGTRSAARALDRQLAGRLTVQIVAADEAQRADAAARVLGLLRTTAGVVRAKPVDRAELAALLRPWLGEDGADPDLPIPAMIDVDLASADDPTIDRVTTAIRAAAPAAQVDRHERWMSPVSRVMDLVTGLAIALVLLMAGATAAVVVLSARAGLEAHRATIEVMHMLGSTDIQVARLFQRRIARDTLIGGATGGVAALMVVAFLGYRIAALGSDLLGGAVLTPGGWIALALLPLLFVAVAAVAARLAVTAALRHTL